ncbi:hypothetical protein [Mycolicibacterium insubricum]|uniref:hypothetical protein n=1 Tax=Mycolicibacterium insubricum TaxID=444597 RepID=UPI0021F26ADB|nr:hypothetical protein [Mycolicibacterium insubricum]MCV7080870.1 hypothetical protein [Mycolicibacterium insubricum]
MPSASTAPETSTTRWTSTTAPRSSATISRTSTGTEAGATPKNLNASNLPDEFTFLRWD